MKKVTARANKSKRTFTIRVADEAGVYAKYITHRLSKAEFEEMQYNTEDDWKNFLRKESYTVKS